MSKYDDRAALIRERQHHIDSEREWFAEKQRLQHEFHESQRMLANALKAANVISRCTCDENCDDPCPAHWRENELENRALKAEEDCKRLRGLLIKVKDFVVFPSSVERQETAEYLKYLHREMEKLSEEGR